MGNITVTMKIAVESGSCEVVVYWDWPCKVTKEEVELEKKVIFRLEPGTTVEELKEIIREHDKTKGGDIDPRLHWNLYYAGHGKKVKLLTELDDHHEARMHQQIRDQGVPGIGDGLPARLTKQLMYSQIADPSHPMHEQIIALSYGRF